MKFCSDYDKVQPCEVQPLLYEPPGLRSQNSIFCAQTAFLWCILISQQTIIIFMYIIKCLVFTVETDRVYCTERTEPGHKICTNCFHVSRAMTQTVIRLPGSVSIPDHAVWDLWWKRQSWDKFVSE